ncbi:Hypothetical predicted protein [Cloeon dipterum]|uniref:FAD-binding PCMH-type domain-containing protein n=1 Tax=Cloeon dipterum TaxID=197152 RepID=A0A8S1DF33_9INSE|nr:Hypothetical predicted protein [Cloeon dipterum]
MIPVHSVDEIFEVIRQAKDNDLNLRFFGNTFPCPNGSDRDATVDISPMRALVACDPEKQMVKIEGGMTLLELSEMLKSFNLALEFAGPMPNFTVIDAISLGMIASNTSIADSLEKCEVVLPSGATKEVRWPTEKEDKKAITEGEQRPELSLQSVVSGLGLSGVITSATFKCVPLHTLLENNRRVSLAQFLENWEKMGLASYICASWFALNDTILVTSAFSMRLHLSYKQPVLDKICEAIWMAATSIASALRSWSAWLFPRSAALMSQAHCFCLRNAVRHRTNFCFPVQKFVPLKQHCRGVKWILPSNRKESVLKKLSVWSLEHPELCSSPAEISIQRHARRINSFLSPHTADHTFSIQVDWFHNTCTYFSPELAEFESLLQMHGGRKCWSVGPVSVSPLIGHLYDGFPRWRAAKSSVDRINLFRSAYVDGDLVIHQY